MHFEAICHLIDEAIKEDVRTGDITSQACIDPKSIVEGVFILKQEGMLAGLPFLEEIFKRVDPAIQIELLVEEGTEQFAGTPIATLSGPAQGIFSAERTALNFLQHASAVATKTAEFLEELTGFECDLLDTRNTVPGLRCLERYAVRVGGGKNHRYALDEWFIIKNSHLAFMKKEAKFPVIEAVQRARAYDPNIAVEVQIDGYHLVDEVIEAEPDLVLLNYMPTQDIARAVKRIRNRAYVEVTGDITLDTIVSYAETGVNGISVPDLTQSIQGLDIRLRFKL